MDEKISITMHGRSKSGEGRIREEKKEHRDMDCRPEEKEEGGARIRVEKEKERLEMRRRSEEIRRIEMDIYWKQGGLIRHNGA